MIVSDCPRCAEKISVPTGATSQARVRCPLCQEEYPLADVLEAMPPLLEVLDDPGGGGSMGSTATRQVGQVSAGAFDFGGSTAVADAPKFEFDERPAPPATKPDAAARPATRPGPRPQRRPKNPAVEVAKIVGGGVVGIALAYLLIWWVAGRDPFKLGPTVHGFAPFLVPDKVMDKYDQDRPSDDPPDDTDTPSSQMRRWPDGPSVL